MHQSHFGWRNFRVLFITTSEERADNMRAAMNGHAFLKGSPLFLFADKAKLYSGNILAHPWKDCEGAFHCLMPGN